jgi:hypothetical protein
MAQHDYVIANGTGAAVRSDLNNALAAIVSQNSGATAPATTYAYMTWADTTAGVYKMRNGANNAWISLYQLDGEWSTIAFENGSAAAPSIYFKDSGTDTGIYSPGTDQVAISTGGTGRLFVSSGGSVGIGVSAPVALLQTAGTVSVTGGSSASSANGLHLYYNTTSDVGCIEAFHSGVDNRDLQLDGKTIGLQIAGSRKVTLTSTGLGIGTTNPGAYSGQLVINISPSGDHLVFSDDSTSSGAAAARLGCAGNNLVFKTNTGASAATERARIDSSGRLLVGTSTSTSAAIAGDARLQVVGNSTGNAGTLALVRSVTAVNTAVLGQIPFADNVGVFAQIDGVCDGTPGTNDYPGRLVFSTTADGAASPTERMRVRSNGTISMGPSASSSTEPNNASGAGYAAVWVASSGALDCALSNSIVGFFNRCQSDGDIISFKQDSITEGTISVSGTTVSYNGAHLSRWSQLPGGAEREEILRGTVLSNIDEMCGWGEEDNEQLNRMKVSDVEGDPNVSGVFQAWDDDDDTYTDDFYCAMTGDFIIRIAEGVTVERGDLLMSAGDGTAKPQDDDIIRSKTVAKVTSTNVSCTYEDGSYCVPCVLMAC